MHLAFEPFVSFTNDRAAVETEITTAAYRVPTDPVREESHRPIAPTPSRQTALSDDKGHSLRGEARFGFDSDGEPEPSVAVVVEAASHRRGSAGLPGHRGPSVNDRKR
jgi:hypothetical protein